jgi:hypothetical protein
MSHPAKQINRTSCQIVNGEYDEAIFTLTNTLKTLKLVLSGDAKILVPKEMEYEDENEIDIDNVDDDFMDSCEESSSSSTTKSSSSPASDCFEYDFYSSPTSSSFLKTTVSCLKGCTIRNSRMVNHSNNNSRNVNVNVNVIAESEKHSGSSSSSANDSARVVPQHQLQVSIFRDPIMVRGDYFRAPLDIHVCEELSYVAIYNLALAHHLKSVEIAACVSFSSSSSCSSDPSTKQLQHLRRVYLHKALSLYEHSHQILMKQSINIGVPVIHSMALVSNLSQIHHALGDHDKAEMCMQYLLSTIMYVIDCGKVDALGNSMDGFFNMILPLISGDVPAPAA